MKKNGNGENAEEKAYRHIINLILNGKVSPGEFLLEEDLALSMDMSRTPVGRALARLVTEGFIDRLPKKGCFVPVPTPEDAEDVFNARMAVEEKTAQAAANNALDAEIEELRAIVSMDHEAVVTFSKESFSNINEALHLGVAKMSRNPYLERWCRYIYWRSSLYIFYFDRFYAASVVEEVPPQYTPVQHAAILEALAARDPQLAGERMLEHVRFTYLQLFRRA